MSSSCILAATPIVSSTSGEASILQLNNYNTTSHSLPVFIIQSRNLLFSESMAERSRTPKRTTGEATRKKKMRPGQRVRVVKDVYTPRIWMWWVMILLLLELIGFCTCQPPSRGWYYRRRLIDYLSMTVIPSCWKLVPSLSLHLSMTVIPFYRQLVSSSTLYLYMKIGLLSANDIFLVFISVLSSFWEWTDGARSRQRQPFERQEA